MKHLLSPIPAISMTILLAFGCCDSEEKGTPDAQVDSIDAKSTDIIQDTSTDSMLDGAPPHDGPLSDLVTDLSTVPDVNNYGPLIFNIILKQTVMACSGCGIWFDWQGDPKHKPRLEVHYTHQGQSKINVYQHGLLGMDNAHSIYFQPGGPGPKHQLLVKLGGSRRGLFRADISDIPPDATITLARWHVHINTKEGLSNTDHSSVLAVHSTDKNWDWDHLSWTHYAPGLPWNQSGGDFGPMIREIRAHEDLHMMGFNKASPNAHFDFTSHVQALQAAR